MDRHFERPSEKITTSPGEASSRASAGGALSSRVLVLKSSTAMPQRIVDVAPERVDAPAPAAAAIRSASVAHAAEAEPADFVGVNRRAAEGRFDPQHRSVPPASADHVNDDAGIAHQRIGPSAFGVRRIRVEAPLPDVAPEIVERAAGPDLVAPRVGLHRGGPAAVTARVAARRDQLAEGEISVFAGGELGSPGPAPPVTACRGPLPLRLGRQRFTLRFAELP